MHVFGPRISPHFLKEEVAAEQDVGPACFLRWPLGHSVLTECKSGQVELAGVQLAEPAHRLKAEQAISSRFMIQPAMHVSGTLGMMATHSKMLVANFSL